MSVVLPHHLREHPRDHAPEHPPPRGRGAHGRSGAGHLQRRHQNPGGGPGERGRLGPFHLKIRPIPCSSPPLRSWFWPWRQAASYLLDRKGCRRRRRQPRQGSPGPGGWHLPEEALYTGPTGRRESGRSLRNRCESPQRGRTPRDASSCRSAAKGLRALVGLPSGGARHVGQTTPPPFGADTQPEDP